MFISLVRLCWLCEYTQSLDRQSALKARAISNLEGLGRLPVLGLAAQSEFEIPIFIRI